MKRIAAIVLMNMLLCSMAISAQAAQLLSAYMDKNALLAHETSMEDIDSCPAGIIRVTRQSLYPWDEACSYWSLFVEIENTSDEKIVIDENELIACQADCREIAEAEDAFEGMTNVLLPGEKAVFHAGAYPYVQGKRTDADVSLDTWDVYGMADFADCIRRAELLCIRLNVRGNQSSQNWKRMDIEPKVWVEESTIHFEWVNTTKDTADFRTIGAVMCDEQGRIVDVIRSSFSRGASVMPGEVLHIEKKMAPYITQKQMNHASFEVFAYRMN